MEVKISAVIITYNEERNIARCLDSVKGIADEVVVVDSYSTDRTEEICKSYGAQFIRHSFRGHIEQKNWAITQARYPHILSLDADEALSDLLRDSIMKVKQNWKHDGYYFNRLTSYCGKWIRHTSWYPSRKLRLWDARKGAWGGFNPHDRFILERRSTRKHLRGDILHYSYYSVNEHMEQINKFSSILARSYFEQGRQAWLISILLHPVWRFFKDYFLRLGFLDGYYGLIVSVNSAHETFLKYVKLRNHHLEYSRAKRQTICFFNSTKSWGGGEKWHFDVSNSFRQRQYPVLVITNRSGELKKRIQYSTQKSYRIRINNLSFLNPLKVIRIAIILRREKVRVLIMNLSADMKVSGIAGRLAGVERIIYRRGSAIPVRDTLLNRFLFRRVLTDVIANSIETKRTLLRNNPNLVHPNKIHVIYNGIHLDKYESPAPEPVIRRKDGEILIGNAGRLVKQKGQEFLIDLAVRLDRAGVDFRIVIAGEGKLQAKLREYARQQGVSDRIMFAGFQRDMRAFMVSLDLFVLTSRWEGFGYVIVEAMMSEKPVVAFDLSSNPEIIEHNRNGYLVPPFDLDALAEAVIDLVCHPGKREAFGTYGKEFVYKQFDYQNTLENVEQFIQSSPTRRA